MHTYQAIYDPLTGKLQVWRDNAYLGSWTDTTPLTSGGYISLRTDGADVSFDGLIVLSVVKYYYSGGQRIALRRDGTVSYLLTDQLGSTRVTTSDTGAQVAEMKYYPFGATRYNSGGQKTTYRFTGQRWDQGHGLYWYNSRWFDPLIGRFLQADSIVPGAGNPQALNRYSYVLGNPLRYTDPTGHANECGTHAGTSCGDAGPKIPVEIVQAPPDVMENIGTVLKVVLAIYAVAFTGPTIAAQLPTLSTTSVGTAATAACADGDCTNEAQEVVNSVTKLRQQYENAVRALAVKADQMHAAGKSAEEIARVLQAERRALGVQYKAITPPDLLEQIYARNLEKYGDKLGPTIDWLIQRGLRLGKSMDQIWNDIIESASRPGGQDILNSMSK